MKAYDRRSGTNSVDLWGNTQKDGSGDVYQVVVDADGNLLLRENGAGGVGDNTLTVTTAGTRVQFPNVAVRRVIVQAHESNTGTIVIGGATAVAALVGRRGVAIYPTQSYVFNVSNLNLLYADSTVSADKVNYYYEV